MAVHLELEAQVGVEMEPLEETEMLELPILVAVVVAVDILAHQLTTQVVQAVQALFFSNTQYLYLP
jgi:hypothetical protein